MTKTKLRTFQCDGNDGNAQEIQAESAPKVAEFGYKITSQGLRTFKGFEWRVGVSARASGKGELCSNG